MRVKSVPPVYSQPAHVVYHAPILLSLKLTQHIRFAPERVSMNKGAYSSQRGAGNLLLVLFIVVVLVTAIAGLAFGHKLGYQRGFYAIQAQNDAATATSLQATKELEELRISHKVLSNQVETSKQELNISLSNLDELREAQVQLDIDSKQVAQLNELYATVISEKGGMPLQVLGAKIEPLPENAFEYGFDVGMLSENGQSTNLTAILTLQNKDNFIEVPLEPSLFSIEGIVRIRGRFVMPSGFTPLQVKLHLEADNQEVEQLYDWKLGDMVDNMPLSLLGLPEVDDSPIVAKPSDSLKSANKAATNSKAADNKSKAATTAKP